MLRDLFSNMPLVVKNLLLINVLLFIVLLTGGYDGSYGLRLNNILGLHYPGSPLFKPYQVVSHMFCHADPMHLFFNMFALVMFGSILEKVWGPKRMFIFYMVCGLGAVVLHMTVKHFEIQHALEIFNDEERMRFLEIIKTEGAPLIGTSQIFSDEFYAGFNASFNGYSVGASGAVYGLLVAFGMLFPNQQLMLIFLPIPIKAKYFIPVLMLIELYLGVKNFEMDNIAHFAHLGGALFGFLLIQLWKRDRGNFY